jgi:small-conductance mechanosensitive channel
MKPKFLISLTLLVVATSVLFAQQQPISSTPQEVIQFLNQTLGWYRFLAVDQQVATEPNEVLFVNDNREIANQVVRLSFDYARAEQEVLSKSALSTQGAPTSNSGALAQTAAKLDNEVVQTQQEIAALRQKLETAPARQRQELQTAIAAAQSELDLINARRDVLHSMVEFMAGATGSQSGGLAAQIDALEHSAPGALAKHGESDNAVPANQRPALPAASKPGASGIWGLIADLVAVSRKLHTLDQSIRITDALNQSTKQLQMPLMNQIRQMAKQSDAVASAPDSTDPAVLAEQKKNFDTLTAQFKLASASFVPLSKQSVLLGLYRGNLSTWRSAVKGERSDDIKSLSIRLGSLALVIIVVFAVAEVWRRAIYRYVHEVRRRYQFLLLRRIVLWFAIVLLIAFSFASELGSLATFAGLLTAGVAVALQNVILSIAGYFFLIGRFGVRVGDRVQISGVTGEVVEIGLVRLHVMELGGTGTDVQPTGRVVAFSNSFVFQPTAGVFKQIPGTNFIWHEITLTLTADTSYRQAEERLRSAVEAALNKYSDDLEQQRVQMERSLGSISVGALQPNIRFHLAPAGLEVTLRFPVELQNAAEIDEQVTREILRAIEKEPQLKLVGSDLPTIKLAPSPENEPVSKAS